MQWIEYKRITITKHTQKSINICIENKNIKYYIWYADEFMQKVVEKI